MSDQEHVFIRADLSPQEVAGRLSDLLGMEVTHEKDGGVFLSRPASGGRPGLVGGEVYENVSAGTVRVLRSVP